MRADCPRRPNKSPAPVRRTRPAPRSFSRPSHSPRKSRSDWIITENTWTCNVWFVQNLTLECVEALFLLCELFVFCALGGIWGAFSGTGSTEVLHVTSEESSYTTGVGFVVFSSSVFQQLSLFSFFRLIWTSMSCLTTFVKNHCHFFYYMK